MKLTTIGAIAAPSIGPAIVTVFGQEIPVLALGLSCAGLILARIVAPPSLRKLSRVQELALTLLLLLVLFLIVTGQLGSGKALGAGMATVWGVGLGFSGLLAVEFFADRVRQMLGAMLGKGGVE